MRRVFTFAQNFFQCAAGVVSWRLLDLAGAAPTQVRDALSLQTGVAIAWRSRE
jgi:hypothetical protein